jgi:hypothetical protein
VASTDGTVWGAVGGATLVQWNQEGDRMQEVPVVAAPVKCLLVVGSRLWAGCTNGKVQVCDVLLPRFCLLNFLLE